MIVGVVLLFSVGVAASTTLGEDAEVCSHGLCSQGKPVASSALLQAQQSHDHVEFEGLEVDSRVDARIAARISGLHTIAERTSALQTEMEAMAEEAIKNKSGVTELTKRALKSIKTEMASVVDGIKKTHREDQDEVNNASSAHHQCNTDFQNKLDEGGDIYKAAASAKTAEEDHDSCRVKQVELLGIKDTSNETLRTAITLSKAPDCLKPHFLPPTLKQIPDKVACIQKVAAWAVKTNTSLVTKFAAFNAATKVYNAKSATCTEKQADLERKFCTYASELSAGCTKHGTCFSGGRNDKDKVYAAVKIAEQARKNQFIAANHIICYANVILLDDVAEMKKKLEECKKLNPNTSHLNIDYPGHPEPIKCNLTPIASRPCDDTWHNERYQAKTAWFVKVPTTCNSENACPAKEAPTAPATEDTEG